VVVVRRLCLLSMAAVTAGFVLACEQESADERPERVVAEFVERMQRVHGDPAASRAAYELLWAEGRNNLAERAKRASAVTGRKVAPEEMLAPTRFWLTFRPRSYSSRVQGNWAVVTVSGEAPRTQHHQVRCLMEDGRWRVVLELPSLPPIQKRETE
jgi:hypothetical protein